MELTFYKYQGTGNDFVVIDDRNEAFDRNDHQLVAHLCSRKFGIGGDGLMLLRNHSEYDFEMIYYNADGFEGSMCGNGGRCLVQFAYDLNVIGDSTTFIATDGPHEAQLKDGRVHLKMIDVPDYEINEGHFFMDTGSPHYIEFRSGLDEMNVYEAGREIRYNSRFKAAGTNVNFVEKISESHLKIRTYERGVEDETLSCGTGATACAIAAHLDGMKAPITVDVLGGRLAIDFTKNGKGYEDVYLIGPAKRVFQGKIDI